MPLYVWVLWSIFAHLYNVLGSNLCFFKDDLTNHKNVTINSYRIMGEFKINNYKPTYHLYVTLCCVYFKLCQRFTTFGTGP